MAEMSSIGLDPKKLDGRVVDIEVPEFDVTFKARIRRESCRQYAVKLARLIEEDPKRYDSDLDYLAETNLRAMGGTVLAEVVEGLEVNGENVGTNEEHLETLMSDPAFEHVAIRVRVAARQFEQYRAEAEASAVGNSRSTPSGGSARRTGEPTQDSSTSTGSTRKKGGRRRSTKKST